MSQAPRTPSPEARPWPDALVAALLLTLERPAAWPVALAGFLARGGLLLFLLPIVVLPTPAGIQADVAPLLVPFAFGQVAGELPGIVAVASGAILLAIVLGGLVGAWADARLAAMAIEEGSGPPLPPAGPGTLIDMLLARLVAHLPLAVALGWGAAQIIEVGYAELVRPFEVVTPLAVRIVAGAPLAVTLVAVAWLLGEAAGGLAVREVLLAGHGSVGGAIRGWHGLVRHAIGSGAELLATGLVVGLALVPGLLAAGAAWAGARSALFDGAGLLEQWLAVSLLSGVWLGALLLAAVGTSFRQHAWTAEWLRRARPAMGTAPEPRPVGTIGGREATRPGG